MKNKKATIVIIIVVIVLVCLYFGASWLIDQMQSGQMPGHFRPPH